MGALGGGVQGAATLNLEIKHSYSKFLPSCAWSSRSDWICTLSVGCILIEVAETTREVDDALKKKRREGVKGDDDERGGGRKGKRLWLRL